MNLIFRNYFKIKKIAFPLFLMLFLSMASYTTNALAAIPLITDDTGTQGKGKFQIELFGEYGYDKEEGLTIKATDLAATFTYGIIDQVDIVLSVPYRFLRAGDDESTEKANGISDLAIETKWRFYENNGLSFALKPGFTLPTGNEDKDLGNGRSTYYLYFITSKEMNSWAFHANLAYFRNDNRGNDRNNIWHASLASTLGIIKNLKLVGDIGVGTNPERSSSTLPAYILGGFIYSLKEYFDIGLGVKGGLTKSEADISVRGGITWRF
jgi:hypothetical protein